MKPLTHVRALYKKDTGIKVTLTLIAFLLVVWGVWRFVDTQVITYPLGDKLVYVGKRDYGCPFICDSGPETVYGYVTNMKIEEVAMYFHKAKMEYPVSVKSDYKDIVLKYNNESATIYYYSTPQMQIRSEYKAYSHYIEFNSSHYNTLKLAL